ncbi:DUF1534 domain-containing protein [Pseudomonas syringae pv. maculicola str. ES4326]|uniref:DUF1534 domain-containing protein n=1 Tax=Pseudomonas syringae pv. maculicola str. ES4326 TaxID=629265 RepID=A0A8T8C7V7_PSEYM|nr:DUF1534 domain-containing protein [Pseudomonas syringae pv. maculicola str. ES4326]
MIGDLEHLSFLTLQQTALRGAPLHRSAPRRRVETGRGASRTACDAERRTIVIVCGHKRGAWARDCVGLTCSPAPPTCNPADSAAVSHPPPVTPQGFQVRVSPP